MRNAFSVFVVLLLSLSSSAQSSHEGFQLLRSWMSGSFSSEAQSKADTDYFHISLRMIPIWKDSPNGFYLYVEQAMAEKLDKPYRQRVYHVVAEGDAMVSRIYSIPRQERFVGKNSEDVEFSQITADSLILKQGCDVRLKFDKANKSFIGQTDKGTCPSDRSGASFTTSEVTLYEGRMVSWDRGWNKEGIQVWGAVKGGYDFRKRP
jgi:hypothetical protein